jgi:hypothetical protein
MPPPALGGSRIRQGMSALRPKAAFIPSARPEYRKAETHCMPCLKINSTRRPVKSAIGNFDILIGEMISSPISLMCSWSLEDRKWVWKLDSKGVAKDAHHHAVNQDERKHPINNRH